MIAPAVPELELVRLAADSMGQDLMPEADAHHRHLAEDARDGLDRVPQLCRIAGSRREDNPIGVAVQYRLSRHP